MVNYEKNVFNMISIDVLEGENEIIVRYVPKYFKEGIIISIGSIVIMLIILLINKKFNVLNSKIVLNIFFVISCLFAVLFIIKMYVLSWLL